jgi:hypothetical protein
LQDISPNLGVEYIAEIAKDTKKTKQPAPCKETKTEKRRERGQFMHPGSLS